MLNLDFSLQSLIFGFFRGFPFGLALLLGFAVPVIVLLASRLLQRISKSARLSFILCAVVVGVSLSFAFSGRTLYSEGGNVFYGVYNSQQIGTATGVRISQFFTIVALFVSAAVLFAAMAGRMAVPGRAFILGFAATFYFGISVVLSGVVGNYREPRFNDFYFVFIAWAVIYLADGITLKFWLWMRIALMLPILGSLVAMALAPQLVLQPGYAMSLIPGFAERLYGLAGHANALGPIAVIALVIELCPKVRPRPSLFFLLPQLAVLLLAQSKTAWLAALLVIPIVRWQWLNDRSAGRDKWTASVIIALCGLAFSIVAGLLLMFVAQSAAFQQFADRSSLFTLTGRFDLWSTTLNEFWKSPLLGYGPSIWDLQFRIERGVLFAGQAHNQFVHILGQAGALGFSAMLAYLGVVAYFALKGFRRDGGLAIALLVLVIFRCMTESPLRMLGIMDWENWTHLLLFCAAAANAAALAPAGQSRPVIGMLASSSGRG